MQWLSMIHCTNLTGWCRCCFQGGITVRGRHELIILIVCVTSFLQNGTHYVHICIICMHLQVHLVWLESRVTTRFFSEAHILVLLLNLLLYKEEKFQTVLAQCWNTVAKFANLCYQTCFPSIHLHCRTLPVEKHAIVHYWLARVTLADCRQL